VQWADYVTQRVYESVGHDPAGMGAFVRKGVKPFSMLPDADGFAITLDGGNIVFTKIEGFGMAGYTMPFKFLCHQE
jgi:hypothetical protein